MPAPRGACDRRFRPPRSRKKPLPAPWTLAGPAIGQPVVQAEGPVAPEFDLVGADTIARPIIRPGHLGEGEAGRIFGDFFLEGPASLHRPGLGRGPSADLAVLGPGGEISVSFGAAHFADIAPDAD